VYRAPCKQRVALVGGLVDHAGPVQAQKRRGQVLVAVATPLGRGGGAVGGRLGTEHQAPQRRFIVGELQVRLRQTLQPHARIGGVDWRSGDVEGLGESSAQALEAHSRHLVQQFFPAAEVPVGRGRGDAKAHRELTQ
jgi:hypothetical protein